ncbi:MAG: hypothetical protein E6I32_06345 [Chloroflexi bacterium]|nr:MAG: hypothetical protein E6I32_06345 [Chloroflexota bacterium]
MQRGWRGKATYVEIEDEVHKRLMQLEAQIIEGAIQESPGCEWGRGSGVDREIRLNGWGTRCVYVNYA